MEIDFAIEIEGLDGQPIPITETKGICPNCNKDFSINQRIGLAIVKTGKNVTLKTVCVNSLMATYEDEKKLSGEEQLKRGKLAERIWEAEQKKTKLDITAKEITLLEDLIAKNPQYNPLFVMRAHELLELEEKKEETIENE